MERDPNCALLLSRPPRVHVWFRYGGGFGWKLARPGGPLVRLGPLFLAVVLATTACANSGADAAASPKASRNAASKVEAVSSSASATEPVSKVASDSSPSAAILEFDIQGGYGLRRHSDEPFVSLRENGEVWKIVERTAPPEKVCVLEADEVEELRSFVLELHSFGQIEQGKLDQTVAAAKKAKGGPTARVADLPSALFRVRLGRESNAQVHEVRYTGLEMDARRYPSVLELTALVEIKRRLVSLCDSQADGATS